MTSKKVFAFRVDAQVLAAFKQSHPSRLSTAIRGAVQRVLDAGGVPVLPRGRGTSCRSFAVALDPEQKQSIDHLARHLRISRNLLVESAMRATYETALAA